jgi:membrane-associated phospholipid phosphatase
MPAVMTTHERMLVRSALVAFALVPISILALDGPLAMKMSSLPTEARRAITQGVVLCEWLFGFRVSPYLYGGLLILAGAVAKARRQTTVARLLVFTGLAHVTARFLSAVMKPPFSRLRPYEALAGNPWQDTWFAPIGNSFPSGHAVHFWSLFFPLIVIFPRLWIPLAILPILISAARVAVNDHYLSDVIASAAVAALVTYAYARTLLSREQTKARS